jgi:hypothetical protein
MGKMSNPQGGGVTKRHRHAGGAAQVPGRDVLRRQLSWATPTTEELEAVDADEGMAGPRSWEGSRGLVWCVRVHGSMDDAVAVPPCN